MITIKIATFAEKDTVEGYPLTVLVLNTQIKFLVSKDKKQWVVSHYKSGRFFCYCRTKKDAEKAITDKFNNRRDINETLAQLERFEVLNNE